MRKIPFETGKRNSVEKDEEDEYGNRKGNWNISDLWVWNMKGKLDLGRVWKWKFLKSIIIMFFCMIIFIICFTGRIEFHFHLHQVPDVPSMTCGNNFSRVMSYVILSHSAPAPPMSLPRVYIYNVRGVRGK